MVSDKVARIVKAPGGVHTLSLDGYEYDEFLGELRREPSDFTVCMLLGRACTTAARTIDQLTVGLQLPFNASQGWGHLFDEIGERPASARTVIVVADACDLLRHEVPELFEELVSSLRGGPSCLGGGWTTVVLLDQPYRWEQSRFGSPEGAIAAAGGRHTQVRQVST